MLLRLKAQGCSKSHTSSQKGAAVPCLRLSGTIISVYSLCSFSMHFLHHKESDHRSWQASDLVEYQAILLYALEYWL